MKITIEMNEITKLQMPSFMAKYYDIQMSGFIKDEILNQWDDFSEMIPEDARGEFNHEDRVKDPAFDFHKFATNHPSSTLLINCIPCDEDCFDVTPMWRDKFSILIHRGKVFNVPFEPSMLDLDQIIASV